MLIGLDHEYVCQMIEHPTVLVLGAGASCTYGFPLGLQLKATICKILEKHNTVLRKILISKHIQDRDIGAFRNDLILSCDLSIEAFMEQHEEYIELGKYAIAATLLPLERHLFLFDHWIDKWLDPNNSERHWYQLLFTKLDASQDKFEHNQLRIVTFNYDRSLEHYLYHCIKAKYRGISEGYAKFLLSKIQVIHVYGQLGSLDKVPYDMDAW